MKNSTAKGLLRLVALALSVCLLSPQTSAVASSNTYLSGTVVGVQNPVPCTNWIYSKSDEIPSVWVLNTADNTRSFPFSGTLRATFQQRCNSYYGSFGGPNKYTSKMEILSPDGSSRELVGDPKITRLSNYGQLIGQCGDGSSDCLDKEEKFAVDLPFGSPEGAYSLRYTVTWAGSDCEWLGGSTFDCKPATQTTVVTMTNAIVFGAVPTSPPTVDPRPTALPSVTATPSPSTTAIPKPNTAISTAPAPVQSLTGVMSGKNIKYKFSKPYYASLVQYYSVKVSFIKANSKSPLYQSNFTTAKRIKVTRSTEFLLSKAAIQKMAKAVGKSSAKYFSVTVTAVTPLGETKDSNGVYYNLK